MFFINSSAKKQQFLRKQGCKIGKNTTLLNSINSYSSEPFLIQIGDNCLVTAGVQFLTHDGGIGVLNNMGYFKNADKFGRVIIQNNVFIGINSIIMPNVTIGNNVVIGAGSVVTKDIPDNCVAAGIPAKLIMSVEEYYIRNKDKVDMTFGWDKNKKFEYLYEKYNIDRED